MNHPKTILITGVSSGIGLALSQEFLDQKNVVYGCSRRTPESIIDHPNFHFLPLDLSELEGIKCPFEKWISPINKFNLVILNAGILGELTTMQHAHLNNLKNIMDINLWANKILCDSLFKNNRTVDQLITISSGAAVNGNLGWSGYSLSKAALNMLTKLYATEYPDTHFCAFAPGLVDTAMQDYLCSLQSEEKFPSLVKIKSARGTSNMPLPNEAAKKFMSVFPELLKHPSGSFVDVRKM
jgi:NAD(P)-dependent dehydrogenase (short-subunit alcohol dehydrogenase family)